MCFIKYFEKRKDALAFKKNPQVAKQDIEVWKGLEYIRNSKNLWQSPHQYFIYEKGQHYYQEGSTKFGIKVEKGWFIWRVEKGWFMWRVEIYMGLHSCKTKYDAKNHGTPKLFIIPKGALYYEDDIDYVSDQLIFPH